MGVHEGHRHRMKQRFLLHGAENFDDHHLLELLLFYALPRQDVNPIAHALLDEFGSLDAVLDAPAEQLCRVPGIGESAAALLRLVPQLGLRYTERKSELRPLLDSPERAGEYLVPRFVSATEEQVYAVCLDAKRCAICCTRLFAGAVNAAEIGVRKLAELAINRGASGMILAHNHAGGLAIPSREDCTATKQIKAALAVLGVELVDHLVIAGGDFVSMADSGLM